MSLTPYEQIIKIADMLERSIDTIGKLSDMPVVNIPPDFFDRITRRLRHMEAMEQARRRKLARRKLTVKQKVFVLKKKKMLLYGSRTGDKRSKGTNIQGR